MASMSLKECMPGLWCLFVCVFADPFVMNCCVIDFERSMITFYEAVNRAHHNNAMGMFMP